MSALMGQCSQLLNAVGHSDSIYNLLSICYKGSHQYSVLPGKYVRLAWRVLKVIFMQLASSSVNQVVSFGFNYSFCEDMHRNIEELFHYCCANSEIWEIELTDVLDSFLGGRNENLALAGLFESLICNSPSSYVVSGRPFIGQLVTLKGQRRQKIVLSNNFCKETVLVGSPDNLDHVELFPISQLDLHLSENVMKRAIVLDKLSITPSALAAVRNFHVFNNNPSVDAASCFKLRGLASMLNIIASTASRSLDARKSILANSQFLNMILDLLSFGPHLQADFNFEVELPPSDVEEKKEELEVVDLSQQIVVKPFSVCYTDPLSLIESALAKQHLAMKVLNNYSTSNYTNVVIESEVYANTRKVFFSFCGDEQNIPLLSFQGYVRCEFVSSNPELWTQSRIMSRYFRDIPEQFLDTPENKAPSQEPSTPPDEPAPEKPPVPFGVLPDSSAYVFYLSPRLIKKPIKFAQFVDYLRNNYSNGAIVVVPSNGFQEYIEQVIAEKSIGVPVLQVDDKFWDTVELSLYNWERFGSVAGQYSAPQASGGTSPVWSGWETPHPCPAGVYEEVFNYPGSSYLMIVLPDSAEFGPDDKLEFFAGGSSSSPPVHSTPISGEFWMWKHRNPTFVKGDTVSVRYSSASDKERFGLMLFIRALTDKQAYHVGVPERVLKIRSQFEIFANLNFINWAVWDSKHPYEDNMNLEKVISFAGAKSLYVVFDPRTKTERNYDHFFIYQGDSQEKCVMEQTNGPIDNFKARYPIKILGDTFNIKFTSDGSGVEWGVRLYIFKSETEADVDMDWAAVGNTIFMHIDSVEKKFNSGLVVRDLHPKEEVKEEEKKDDSPDQPPVPAAPAELTDADINFDKWKVWETKHPYLPKLERKEDIIIPGAIRLIGIIDRKTRLEKGFDFVKIYPKADKDAYAYFNFTGVIDTDFNPVFSMEQNHFVLEQVFDDNITDWGMRIFIYPVMEGEEPLSDERRYFKFLSDNYDRLKNKFIPIQGEIVVDTPQPPPAPAPLDPTKPPEKPDVKEETPVPIIPVPSPAPLTIDPVEALSQPGNGWYFWQSLKPQYAYISETFTLKVPNAKHIVVIIDPRSSFKDVYLSLQYETADEWKFAMDSTFWEVSFVQQKQVTIMHADNLKISLSIYGSGSGEGPIGFKFYIYASFQENLEQWNWVEYARAFSLYESLLTTHNDTDKCSQIRKLQLQDSNRFDIAEWETSHPPVPNNETTETVTLKGAFKLVVSFDPRSSLPSYTDTLNIYKGNDMNSCLYSFNSEAIDPEFTFVVPGDTVTLKMTTFGAHTKYGVKLYIRAIKAGNYAPLMSSIFSPIRDHFNSLFPSPKPASFKFLGDEWRVWETDHPYQDNMDKAETVTIPGASKLVIVFDPLTKTETMYDWLKIFKGTDQSTPLLSGVQLTGEYAVGFADKDPIEVEGDSVTFFFHSDGGTTYWGVRCFIKGIFSKDLAVSEPDDEKFSMINRPANDLPPSFSDASVFPIEMVCEAIKRSGVIRRNITNISNIESQFLEETSRHCGAKQPYELGFFPFQPRFKACATYVNLARMLMFIHASRLAAYCVPELTRDQLYNLDKQFGQKIGAPLKLLWMIGRAQKEMAATGVLAAKAPSPPLTESNADVPRGPSGTDDLKLEEKL
eukprot:TRINITY_DN39119_c0_g1_i2.p1 TRINITY_DN39119_c0_g1~~TRINITY_DN39119_c0_g1_i2.p1  ORF type:complete len:1734 (-),score=427.89 TRINITY_DN39119_c0_g1_i2:95-4999(-)